MSLAPKTPPRLALTIIIRQIDSNHQNYLGRAVVFYFCIFAFSKKIQLSQFFVFCIFVFSKKYKFYTLHFFCIFVFFKKCKFHTLHFFCILFVCFLYYFCIIFVFFGICTFWKIQKYKKNAKCGICIFWKIQKYKIQKNAKVVFFLKIQKCNINKNVRLVFVQKMQKKQEPICLQVANYRNYNEDPRGTKLPRLFCNNSR